MYSKLVDKLAKIRENKGFVLKFILPAVAVVFVLFMYLPFLSINLEIVSSHIELWDRVYTYLSPYSVLPYIVGIISLLFNGKYKNPILKIYFTLFYICSIIVSTVNLLEMTNIIEAVYYIPLIFIMILHLSIWNRQENM